MIKSRLAVAFTAMAFAGGALSALAAEGPDACPVAGRYAVVGYVPDATNPYRGEATISPSGAGCYMKWSPPNESDGNGDYSDGVLTIYFTFANGGSGVVKYTRASNGELRGTWWMDADPGRKGTETLTPIS
jgi:hypothetical protein